MPLVTTRASVAYGAGFGKVLGATAEVDNGVMFPIGTVTLTSSTNTITFTSIPSTYTHLQLRGIFRTDYGTGAGGYLRLNNDQTSSIYRAHVLYANGSAVESVDAGALSTGMYWGSDTGVSSGANSYGYNVADFVDYKNTNKFKTVRILSGKEDNSSGVVQLTSGLYKSTTAISRIDLIIGGAANWVAGTTVSLYGIL